MKFRELLKRLVELRFLEGSTNCGDVGDFQIILPFPEDSYIEWEELQPLTEIATLSFHVDKEGKASLILYFPAEN